MVLKGLNNTKIKVNVMDEVQKLYSQLNDVTSLQATSIFPLAYGWWVVLGILTLFLIYSFFVVRKNYIYKKSWKYKVIKQFDDLQKNFKKVGKKQTISELNEILKRAAITDYSRKEVAKLIGKRWLLWLQKKDSNNFDWVRRASFLIEAPYIPEDKINVKKNEIFRVIEAAKNWVK
jgi:hypothetical protein